MQRNGFFGSSSRCVGKLVCVDLQTQNRSISSAYLGQEILILEDLQARLTEYMVWIQGNRRQLSCWDGSNGIRGDQIKKLLDGAVLYSTLYIRLQGPLRAFRCRAQSSTQKPTDYLSSPELHTPEFVRSMTEITWNNFSGCALRECGADGRQLWELCWQNNHRNFPEARKEMWILWVFCTILQWCTLHCRFSYVPNTCLGFLF